MDDKTRELVDQLLEKTANKQISWEPTASSGEYISTFGGKVTFVVEAGFQWPEFKMLDESRRTLVTASAVEIQSVSQLYEEARKMALKVDESLDNVLAELKKLK